MSGVSSLPGMKSGPVPARNLDLAVRPGKAFEFSVRNAWTSKP